MRNMSTSFVHALRLQGYDFRLSHVYTEGAGVYRFHCLPLDCVGGENAGGEASRGEVKVQRNHWSRKPWIMYFLLKQRLPLIDNFRGIG